LQPEYRQGKILPVVVLLFRAETKSGNVISEAAAAAGAEAEAEAATGAEAVEAEVVSPITVTAREDRGICRCL
jgi:hypothetical protein